MVKPVEWIIMVLLISLLAVGIYTFVRFMQLNWSAITAGEAADRNAERALEAIQSGRRVQDLSFVVISGPGASDPSSRRIERTINAAIAMHGMPERVVVALDAPPGGSDPNYDQMQNRLEEVMPYAHVVRLDQPGYRTGTIELAMKHVETRFVLMLSDSFKHITPVELTPLMKVIEDRTNDVQYIRFNKRSNWQVELEDAHPGYAMETRTFDMGRIELTTTPAWLDDDHLCLKSYYTEIVLPIVAGQFAPQTLMNSRSRDQPGMFGTYIYGPTSQPNTIETASYIP